ncbi:hypothetical protein BDA96_05G069200 [Sorghum bicolor]|uniref:Uncharacterized protein n=1 Tax=Sorghum bicolor TaxID=4558 RepID=A0A921QWP6_SORBI|nr:hypothetical protein BDA96_05G069200 [Sorghum bicolor]
MAAMFEGIENFLLRDFFSQNTFKKNYEMDNRQMTSDAIDKRYEGYQKICLYGLGSVFWGAATGVLSNIQAQHPTWIFWGSIYFVVSLVLMLNGLTAASFSNSIPLPLATAGLGAWAAYIYMLATFHVASLSFHSNVEECGYSMIISSIAVTIHWTYSTQDPLVFLVLGKLVVWLLLIVPYAVVKLLLQVPSGITKLISTLRGLICNDGNPLKCFLLEQKSAHEITWCNELSTTA